MKLKCLTVILLISSSLSAFAVTSKCEHEQNLLDLNDDIHQVDKLFTFEKRTVIFEDQDKDFIFYSRFAGPLEEIDKASKQNSFYKRIKKNLGRKMKVAYGMVDTYQGEYVAERKLGEVYVSPELLQDGNGKMVEVTRKIEQNSDNLKVDLWNCQLMAEPQE